MRHKKEKLFETWNKRKYDQLQLDYRSTALLELILTEILKMLSFVV